jgi:hypothetical protein
VIRPTRAFAATACWAVVLPGVAPVAEAQTAGELAGIVRDATGAVVPGATVTVTGKSLPASVVVETDQQGRFVLTLPPGLYDVRAGAAGFASWEREVEVKAGGTMLDIPLRVDKLRDGVTVTATRTGTADIQTTGVAITALDADALDAGAVERVEHLAGLVPTLSISHTPGGTPLLTLRGIGSNSAVPGGDPNVTMQVDGVYLAGAKRDGARFPRRRASGGAARPAGHALRPQLRGRHHQHRDEAAHQRARGEGPPHRRKLRQVPGGRRRQRAAGPESNHGQRRLSPRLAGRLRRRREQSGPLARQRGHMGGTRPASVRVRIAPRVAPVG